MSQKGGATSPGIGRPTPSAPNLVIYSGNFRVRRYNHCRLSMLAKVVIDLNWPDVSGRRVRSEPNRDVDMPPSVSVIMAVRNGQRFLREAVESVLSQTWTRFEFVIVDDGSTDATAHILGTYRDDRILKINQRNLGLPAALNLGIGASHGSLIARMDADDRMLPDRLERQLTFLEEHPDAGVICSHAWIVNAKGKRIAKSMHPVEVDRALLEGDPSLFLNIVHPSVMMRRDAFEKVGGYNKGLPYAEDRELWGRIATSGLKIHCQPEFLMEYRLHGGAMSMKRLAQDAQVVRLIDTNIIRRWTGKHELTTAEYEAEVKARSFLQRWGEYRRFLAARLWKNATRHYAEGDIASLVLSLGAAAALSPGRILNRFFSRGSLWPAIVNSGYRAKLLLRLKYSWKGFPNRK